MLPKGEVSFCQQEKEGSGEGDSREIRYFANRHNLGDCVLIDYPQGTFLLFQDITFTEIGRE